MDFNTCCTDMEKKKHQNLKATSTLLLPDSKNVTKNLINV